MKRAALLLCCARRSRPRRRGAGGAGSARARPPRRRGRGRRARSPPRRASPGSAPSRPRPRRTAAARAPTGGRRWTSAPATRAARRCPSSRSSPRPSDPARPVERIVVFPNIQDNWRLRAGPRRCRSTPAAASPARSTPPSRAARRRGEDLRPAGPTSSSRPRAPTGRWSRRGRAERVLQEAIRAYDAHLADARNRERFGMAARNEVLAVQVERDRVELDRLRAEAGGRRRRGQPAPAARPAPRHARRAGRAARGAPRRSRPTSRPSWPRPQAGRAERKALAARVAAADAIAGAERGARLPQVALTGGLHLREPQPRHRAPHHRLEGHLGRRRGPLVERVRRGQALGERGPGAGPGRRRARAAARAGPGDPPRGHAARRSSCAPPRRGSRVAERSVESAAREPPGGRRPLPRGRHPLLRAARRRGRARAGGARPHRGPGRRCASPPRASIGRWADEPASLMAPAVEIRELSRRFGAFKAVDRVSLSVERGRDLRLPRRERRRQVHDDPHALRPPAADLGHGPRPRHRRRRRSPRG